ncbi:type IV pilus modification PilV family protein [Vibrio brasiliensis]
MRNRQTGFSLIEVLITMLLSGTTSLALVQLQVYIEQRAEFAVDSVTALSIAEQKTERLRRHAGFLGVSSLASGTDSSSHSKFQLAWQIQSMSWPSSVNLKQVEVYVEWHDRLGQPQMVSLKTMFSD